MQVFSYKDENQLVDSLARYIFEKLPKIERLALPTGRTPKALYTKLAQLINASNISLNHLSTYNLDEFLFLKEDNKKYSYAAYMENEFFSKLDRPFKANYFPSDKYDENIFRHGGLDLALIGIGENGHIAFNEPGSLEDSPTRVVELREGTRKQNALMYQTDLENIPKEAITIGLKSLLSSNEIILIAIGAHKREILEKSFDGQICSNCPASFLQNHSSLSLFVDKKADWRK